MLIYVTGLIVFVSFGSWGYTDEKKRRFCRRYIWIQWEQHENHLTGQVRERVTREMKVAIGNAK